MKSRFDSIRRVREVRKPLPLTNKIPVPELASELKGMFPYEKMKVGDSFFAEGRNTIEMSRKNYYQSMRLGRRYICRTVREGKKVGTRVWRIE